MAGAVDLAIQMRGARVGQWHIEHIELDASSAEDGSWSAGREAANARIAVRDPSVIAYIGPYNSGAARVSLPVTNRAGLLQLSPTCTWPGLTETGWDAGEPDIYYPTGIRTFARLMPPDSRQAEAAAQWADSTGARTVFVLRDGSSYSNGLAARFMRAARALGMQIAGEAQADATSAADVAGQVGEAAPDAVFYAPGTTGNAVAMARALARLPDRIEVFSTDVALSDQFLEAVAGDGGDGRASRWHIVFNGVTSPPDTAGWQRFRSAFIDRYGSAPGQFAANAYDLTNLVLDAIQQTGSGDRQAIARTVLATRNYRGVTGLISFDSKGDVQGWRMSGYVPTAGRFVLDRILQSEH